MRKFIFILLLIIFSISDSNANIYRGYDMSLISLGNDLFKLRLSVYIRGQQVNQIDSFINFNIYKNINNNSAEIPIITVYRTSIFPAPPYDPNGCPKAGFSINNYTKIIYESNSINLSSLNSPGGYYVTKSMNGRYNLLKNILNPSTSSILFTMEFPRLDTNSLTRNNSSPRFKKDLFYIFRTNKLYSFNFDVEDLDGDSLVYYLEKPYDGGTTTKPFQYLTLSQGYKLDSNLADGAPDFTINNKTGDITYKPTIAFRSYVVTIKVEEWKRATSISAAYKIGEIKREFQFDTKYWGDIFPVIKDDKNRTKNVVDTISFANGGVVNYSRIFNSSIDCYESDTLSLRVIPSESPYNIFNTNLANTTLGFGLPIQIDSNSIIKDECSIRLNLNWTIDSTMGNNLPVKFRIISNDNNCPNIRRDTMDVSIYIPYMQCYKTLNVIQLKGCDSVKGLNGIWYKKDGLYIDTVKRRSGYGCDTIWVHNVTLGLNRVTYNLSGCDSVIGLDNKIYKTSGTYIFIIPKSDCDSIITQVIEVYQSASKKPVIGEQYPAPFSIQQYSFAKSQSNTLVWSVENGNFVSRDSLKAEIRWKNTGIGKIIANEINQMGCSTINELIIYVGGTTGIDNKYSNIKIYPNPTNDFINIEGLTIKEYTRINIYDIQGKLILTKELIENGTIDISGLNNGVYVIKIGEMVQRIVKI